MQVFFVFLSVPTTRLSRHRDHHNELTHNMNFPTPGLTRLPFISSLALYTYVYSVCVEIPYPPDTQRAIASHSPPLAAALPELGLGS